ncbi:RDD family protein [Altericroceibacterium xinjiangense]|uniref:RDD family protein n=1 Tax=Altericroceibacterium xinjiangense TaxID=762261 RepID=UPI000F7F4C65|nr:RDD family protein [Altericroceibacterium xinjiangense]
MLAPRSLKRGFVTPEGVDLKLELGSAAARAAAFLIDALILMALLIAATLALIYLGSGPDVALTLWLVGFFFLRVGWFVVFEMGSRGGTPGKRLLGLRVVARDGARLTAAAVIARNAMREIEVFLPLSFLGTEAAEGTADRFLILFALIWSGTFLFFPLFNRDRLRVGDLVAGTWVVQTREARLVPEVLDSAVAGRRQFSDEALSLYGIYELHTLEDVLRGGRADSMATVACAIRAKAGIADDGDDPGFLADYYAALRTRLEAGLLTGQRRADKFS